VWDPKVESVGAIREAAEQLLRRMSGDAEGSSLFKGWWQLHSQDISKLDFDVQIVQAGSGGFTASFYSLSPTSIQKIHRKVQPFCVSH